MAENQEKLNRKKTTLEDWLNNDDEQSEMLAVQMDNEFDPQKLYLKSYKFSNIHSLIKQARMVNDYTQEEFCKKLKINRSTYSRYENGERQIPYRVMDKIFEVLDIKMIIAARDEQEILDEQIEEWENDINEMDTD